MKPDSATAPHTAAAEAPGLGKPIALPAKLHLSEEDMAPLRRARAKLQALMGRVEADREKCRQSQARYEGKVKRERALAKAEGYEPDPESIPAPDQPDHELARQFHHQHYQVAALEKGLGINQEPVKNPVQVQVCSTPPATA